MNTKYLIVAGIIFVIIIFLYNNKCIFENFNSTCYDTQQACIQDCVEIYTFTPNSQNKWWFYNGTITQQITAPSLTFTKYPNNVIEVNCTSKSTLTCSGDGWLYFSLTDGVWKQGNIVLSEPPAIISNLTYDSPANLPNKVSSDIKFTGKFPINIIENADIWAFAGIGKNMAVTIPDNRTNGNMDAGCCPKLFFYVKYPGWMSAGGNTTYTIFPFVGRFQG